MRLASSKNKNVIRFLLLWIYMFLLEPEICCAVEGSSMEKVHLCYKCSNKILSHAGYSAGQAGCDQLDCEAEQGCAALAEALPVPRAAAACAVIPIPTNPWTWSSPTHVTARNLQS